MSSPAKSDSAKLTSLQRSVQGMKTQQGYVRGDLKAAREQIAALRFYLLVLFISVALFYATLILGKLFY